MSGILIETKFIDMLGSLIYSPSVNGCYRILGCPIGPPATFKYIFSQPWVSNRATRYIQMLVFTILGVHYPPYGNTIGTPTPNA